MDLDKFLEDVKNGIYPLIAFALSVHRPLKLLSQSPSAAVLPSSKMTDEHSLTTSASAPHNIGQEDNQTSVAQSHNGTRKNSTDDILTLDMISESNGVSADESRSEPGASNQHTNSDSHSSMTAASTMPPNNLPPYIDTSSATSTITSMTGSLGSPTALEASSTVSSQGASSSNGGDKPQGETRLIRHMRAAIKDQILNMLLQLDDYMNRQLTAEVTENDRAEELVSELIAHGFICQVSVIT